MTRRSGTQWWKCPRKGCEFNALTAAGARPEKYSPWNSLDLASRLIQTHLIEHLCDMLAAQSGGGMERVALRAISAGERLASVIETDLIARNGNADCGTEVTA